jgi:nicotinamidase-related amidase
MLADLRLLAGLAAFTLVACASLAADEPVLKLNLRSQSLAQDATGHNVWRTDTTSKTFKPSETALLLCDVWDKHWCRGANERLAAMLPRMNETVKAARAAGITIIHAPSETMDFYKDSPARQRVREAPSVPIPPPAKHDAPPLPIDASDQGSDTGEKSWFKAWTRQHPAIEIDETRDGISDNGQEIWNFMQARGMKNLILFGVHANMCILNRPFAIKAMVPRGVNVMLVRDLTDTMYNPERSPYVSHEEGTRLVVEYIEKFWCPTILSEDLLKAAPAGKP